MSNYSKFDTQVQAEEIYEYEPTAADLAELDEWIDELEIELDRYDTINRELDELEDVEYSLEDWENEGIMRCN
jgi:hypothetical protein|tara:strand:- start:276 stop:494 length:219 start_codon:yes stop_codon:yes gene_type:complete